MTRWCQELSGYHPNGVAPCGEAAVGDLDGVPLCRNHFIGAAVRLLDRAHWPSLRERREDAPKLATVPTFAATIYVGFRVGQPEDPTFTLHTIDEARAICRDYCDQVGLCVTLTPTEFLYTNGGEPGVAVGLINYPRFPSTPEAIREHALALAEKLRVGLGQWRVSVVMPDETVMLGDADPQEPAPCN